MRLRLVSTAAGVGVGVLAAAIFISNQAATGSSDYSTNAEGQTFGRVPDSAFNNAGGIDTLQVPDYVLVAGDTNEDFVGYVKSEDIVPREHGSDIPDVIEVFGADLKTVVGHMHAGRGFVPLGQRNLPPLIEVETWSD